MNDDTPYSDESRTRDSSTEGVAEDDAVGTTEPAGDESRWGKVALLVAVVGIGLFIFPEPATSLAGGLLAAIGVLAWLVDRFV